MKDWEKMPSYWITNNGENSLSSLRWSGSDNADKIAALMIYIVFVHHAKIDLINGESVQGICSLSYSELSEISGLSRAKVSGGIKILIEMKRVKKILVGRKNRYQLLDYASEKGWAKLPVKKLYSETGSRLYAFHRFHLRVKNELNALKMYLLIAAFRSNSENCCRMSYERITEYTGINRNEIRSAISLLINLGLIQVDTEASKVNDGRSVNLYRLCYLEPYMHRGTLARTGL
ncbi:helix-turn-helix domain-containing protein [Thiomicrorhabdus sp. zzn3]|uniref:helix-turn-helix domain-containing protein n=1 Tax=Thiomicrorhabdus sp. zzn3 TaxID=3039775 RepID=UPI002436DAFF|nr:helix-turn-helix domain-containing protein [Thiomicrorhabdus sp. zzn3]MDG6778313.1 helix-turn-helix domain-containing protein [Thiomicrorhabdus sp. zzn3]